MKKCKLIVGSLLGLILSAELANAGFSSPPVNVRAWGQDYRLGITNIPLTLTNAVMVRVGTTHALAHKSDGTVVAWGSTNDILFIPPADLSNVVDIAVGQSHSLALKADGTVVAWGHNDYGELNTPSGIVAKGIAAGIRSSWILKIDGTVIGFGYDNGGQYRVPDGLTNVVAISSHFDHVLALKSDGTVVAWGNNNDGETNVPVGLNDVVAVSAGDGYSLALKSDGTVVAWGLDENNECHIPLGLIATSISAGSMFSLALKSDGTVVAWGGSSQYLLPTNLTNISQISVGSSVGMVIIGPLSPMGSPPVIMSKLSDRTIGVGSSTLIRVLAKSDLPITYQWYFGTTPIPYETNSTISLTNVQSSMTGEYLVIVNNAVGSAFAIITVNILPEIRLGLVSVVAINADVGSTVVVQGINQYGSTTNWSDLATVVVTNQPMMWIDLSVFGQPSSRMRFYRVMVP
ncbi:MAG: hypothetical protein NTZ38_02570 [Candidatus Taylorbacteria bacterium]|nr:hypothetical protein [Candidatus Taylorbacteria bacterium]